MVIFGLSKYSEHGMISLRLKKWIKATYFFDFQYNNNNKKKKIQNKAENTFEKRFVFQKLKWLQHTKEEKYSIFCKTSLKDIFKRLDLSWTD